MLTEAFETAMHNVNGLTRKRARRNPVGGGTVLLGVAVLAALAGGGYLLYERSKSGSGSGGGSPAPQTFKLGLGVNQSVSAHAGDGIVVDLSALPGSPTLTATATGGVALKNQTGSVFTFAVTGSGTISISENVGPFPVPIVTANVTVS